MSYILVTGGSGYVGSQTNLALVESGFQTVIFDAKKPKIESIWPPNQAFVQGNLMNSEDLKQLFEHYKIDAVLHFAAYIEARESQSDPQKYYYNNVAGTLNLLFAMREAGVDKIIFSSTAAVYGFPETVPILETAVKNPVSTYGQTKLIIEQILTDYHRAYGLSSFCLRYFNAAGGDGLGRTGEMHEPETHLIPIILEVLSGERDSITVFGDDYKTQDGTCVRDYIHTQDLAAAHVLALKKLLSSDSICDYINLATKRGYSVKEIIAAVERVTGIPVKYSIGQRKSGDPDFLVADNTKAGEILGWQPQYSNIDNIVRTAWQWKQKVRGEL